MTEHEYIEALISAIKANPHAHAFYFPTNRQDRATANLRLGREIGYGLASYDKPDLQSLYGRVIVRFSLDRIGVAIDASDLVKALQAGIARGKAYRNPLELD